MASKNRRYLAICLFALLCLLLASNLHQISAESSENGLVEEEDAGEEEGNNVVQDGEHDEGDDDEDEEDEDEEFEGNGGEDAVDETDVVVLGSNNFTSFVAANRYVMVEFYAPWCGHCQQLAPEWAAAATVLKEQNISVAKVDATMHQAVGELFGVTSYPTLFFFIDGGNVPFTGERTK